MGWKDILIQVGSGPREAERLAIAAELAERLGAQLRGAYLRGPRLVDVAAASADLGWMLSADVQRVTLEQEADDERAAEQARGCCQTNGNSSPVGRSLPKPKRPLGHD